MKLSDELFERGKNQKEICSIIDDDYVLLHKVMPCTDDELDNYLKNMKNAKKSGINIACVTDYKPIQSSTRKYSNKSYTSGVFIEERAKGITPQDNIGVFLSSNKEYNYEIVAKEYLSKLNSFVQSLEYQASASQAVFDKLVSDVLDLANYDIVIDPKPLNFFFDKDLGYTIIDPIPKNIRYDEEIEFIPIYILLGIFGYGTPYISSQDNKRLIPMDLLIRMNNATNTLMYKVKTAMKKRGLKEEDIDKAIQRTLKSIGSNIETVNVEDLPMCIEYMHQGEKQKSL